MGCQVRQKSTYTTFPIFFRTYSILFTYNRSHIHIADLICIQQILYAYSRTYFYNYYSRSYIYIRFPICIQDVLYVYESLYVYSRFCMCIRCPISIQIVPYLYMTSYNNIMYIGCPIQPSGGILLYAGASYASNNLLLITCA